MLKKKKKAQYCREKCLFIVMMIIIVILFVDCDKQKKNTDKNRKKNLQSCKISKKAFGPWSDLSMDLFIYRLNGSIWFYFVL